MRASITRQATKLSELEYRTPLSPTDELAANRMAQKVRDLDKDFKEYHILPLAI